MPWAAETAQFSNPRPLSSVLASMMFSTAGVIATAVAPTTETAKPISVSDRVGIVFATACSRKSTSADRIRVGDGRISGLIPDNRAYASQPTMSRRRTITGGASRTNRSPTLPASFPATAPSSPTTPPERCDAWPRRSDDQAQSQ
jgi:hypothetical protein